MDTTDRVHHHDTSHGERRRIGDMRVEIVTVLEVGDKLASLAVEGMRLVREWLAARPMDPEDKAAFEAAAAKLNAMADVPKT